jgi:hypothetical protein
MTIRRLSPFVAEPCAAVVEFLGTRGCGICRYGPHGRHHERRFPTTALVIVRKPLQRILDSEDDNTPFAPFTWALRQTVAGSNPT